MLWVVGTGPEGTMSTAAVEAIRKAEVLVGYHRYVEQVRHLSSAEAVTYSMGEERERCLKALELSRKGLNVALLSGGDPGIFGMASLVLELAEDEEVEVIPSLPSLSFAAARVGAPLGADFSLVSLSDLLVPWERIVYLLDRAAVSDTSIVLINPGSRRRRDRLPLAANTILRYRPPNTPVAVVENACQRGERITVTNLKELEAQEFTSMNAIVFIGNSRTVVKNNRLITDRGYFRRGVISHNIELGPIKSPKEIETASLRFIKEHLKAHRFPPAILEIVARMVHAVADFSIASEVAYSEDFVEKAREVIRSGGTVWTDTEMASCGISWDKVKPLPKPSTPPKGTTRTAWGLRSVKEQLNNSLLVVGNAPTVLFELMELMKEGHRPKAVIGCPVGFVGAAESKRLLMKSGIPYLTITGNRGGTPLAVAATNALIRLANHGD